MDKWSTNWNVIALVAAGLVAVAGLWWLAVITGEEPQEPTVQQTQQTPLEQQPPVEAVVGDDHIEATQQKGRDDGEAAASTGIDVTHRVAAAFPMGDAPPAPMAKADIVERLEHVEPQQWGEVVDGVKTRLDTDADQIALTLDACDGGWDPEIIKYLREHRIPATLFVSGMWINTHRQLLKALADDPLFEIANHGLRHLPCSVTGRQAAGIEGTDGVEEAYREIAENARRIEAVTGDRPRFYRSGTAHYDEVCTRIAHKTGHWVAGFDVVGDLGAMYDGDQVYEAVVAAGSGSIVVVHVNKPDGDTAAGLKRALPELVEAGYDFVRLSDVSVR